MSDARVVTWRRTERFGHPEVFALLGLASFLVARFLPVLGIPFTCPLRGLAGIPCATCGMTHAFVHLAHGAVGAALAASPLGAVLAAAAWAFAVADLLRAAAGWPLPVPSPRLARAAALLALVALLANWAFLVVREGA
ncbi:MAG TPA: DUF2752 domain-containing protein [Anaeromyxobacter sp.]|nr:DUF2752 domain-containing protein [Anaeromyxobacter sp.]